MPRISPNALRVLTEERRRQILDAAVEVFSAKGYQRATIADIAHAARVAEGSIYNYFKNKEDLLVCIPRHVADAWMQSAILKMPASGNTIPPEQMLTDIAQNTTAAIRRNSHIFRILMSALPNMKQATRQKYLTHNVNYLSETLEKYFRVLIAQGIFREDLDPTILTFQFIGMFFPFIMFRDVLQITAGEDWDFDQVIAQAVQLFLHGVMPSQGKG